MIFMPNKQRNDQLFGVYSISWALYQSYNIFPHVSLKTFSTCISMECVYKNIPI